MGALDPKAGPLLRKVAAALVLIRELSPALYRRVRGNISRILVAPLRGLSGAHYFGTATCALDEGFVSDYPTGMIAGTLVHEATHARISRAGTIAIWGAGGRRAEVLCTRSERAFAQLLSTADYPSLDDWLHYLDKRIEALQADIGGTRPAA